MSALSSNSEPREDLCSCRTFVAPPLSGLGPVLTTPLIDLQQPWGWLHHTPMPSDQAILTLMERAEGPRHHLAYPAEPKGWRADRRPKFDHPPPTNNSTPARVRSQSLPLTDMRWPEPARSQDDGSGPDRPPPTRAGPGAQQEVRQVAGEDPDLDHLSGARCWHKGGGSGNTDTIGFAELALPTERMRPRTPTLSAQPKLQHMGPSQPMEPLEP